MTGAHVGAADLRQLVREVLREVVPDLVAARSQGAASPAQPKPADVTSGAVLSAGTGWRAPQSAPPDATDTGRSGDDGVELVRLDNDHDLDAFVRRLVSLFDNPRLRAELRSGKRRFRLVPSTVRPANPEPRRLIERGAVTEAQVKDAARAGARLVLGRRAVLTPLARDRARSLGVPIEKET